jgi:hypothetical protein
MKRFSSSLDTAARIIAPAIVIIVLLAVVYPFFYQNHWIGANLLLIPAVFVLLFLMRPTGITLDENAITIERTIMPVVIPYSQIVSAEAVETEDMKFTLRAFGNGGFFGYFGIFYNSKYKFMRWYCTQRKNYILITLDNKRKIVISPDDQQGLLLAVRSYLPKRN